MALDFATILAGLKQAGGSAVTGLKRVGDEAQQQIGESSNLDIANAALGVAGGLAFMGAKKPTIERPQTLTSVVPVQNYEADRNAGYNQVAQNASTAMNNVRSQMGADWSAYASAALGVNAQSNQAMNQINSQIGTQKRQDNIAAAQQLNADREFNYTTQRSFDEAQYNERMQAYQGQRTQGAGMMQSSLNYMVNKDADNRAFAEKQKLANQQLMGTALENELRYNEDRAGVITAARSAFPELEKFYTAMKPQQAAAPAATPAAAAPAPVTAAPTFTNPATKPQALPQQPLTTKYTYGANPTLPIGAQNARLKLNYQPLFSN